MKLKIEILLVSFTYLILTLKYSVLIYKTDWNDNSNRTFYAFFLFFSTDRTQFVFKNL